MLTALAAPAHTAAPAPPREPAEPAAGWVGFKVTTANVKSFPVMPQDRVQADYDRIRALRGSVLFQEIEPARYKQALSSTFSGSRVDFIDRTPVPVALDRAWTVKDRGIARMHKGLARVSPTRFVTWQKVARTRGDRTVRFVLMNTHFVSGAWNRKPDRADAWRKAHWKKHFAKMGDLVRSFNAQGLTVVGGGDFNRSIARGLKKFTGTQRWLYSDGGIDKIFVAPAPDGARVVVKRTFSTRGFSDHAFRTAVLKIGPSRR